MWSQYRWNSSQLPGTGFMESPYSAYQRTCSSKSVCRWASVSPPPKHSATRTVSMKKVACAQ